MPHDLNGNLLEAGDTVTMAFKVKAVHTESDFCNIDLESVEVMPGNGFPTLLSNVNTKMVEKV